jgi:hypothetical protein
MRGLSYVTVAELKCLYAIVHKIRYSQVVDIVNYFKKIRTLAGPIECTSMITRITLNLGCPEMAHMSYIEGVWLQYYIVVVSGVAKICCKTN